MNLFAQVVSIDGRKFKLVEQIGEGGFGYVHKAVESKLGIAQKEVFAIKRLLCQSNEQEEEAQREINALEAVKGESHLLELKAWTRHSVSNNAEILLLTKIYAGDLQKLIDQGPGYPKCCVPMNEVLHIMSCCCKGIQALHKHGLKHNDIKPANVLLSADRQEVVIVDFGSTEPLDVAIHTRQQALLAQETAATRTTAPYRAPEYFDCPSECVLGPASDVWSLGCMLYALLFSRSPFEHPKEGVQTLKIIAGQVSFPPWESGGPDGASTSHQQQVESLVRAMLTANLQNRMPLDQVIISLDQIASGTNNIDALTIPQDVEQEAFADFSNFDALTPSPTPKEAEITLNDAMNTNFKSNDNLHPPESVPKKSIEIGDDTSVGVDIVGLSERESSNKQLFVENDSFSVQQSIGHTTHAVEEMAMRNSIGMESELEYVDVTPSSTDNFSERPRIKSSETNISYVDLNVAVGGKEDAISVPEELKSSSLNGKNKEGPILQYRSRGFPKHYMWKEVWLSLDEHKFQVRKKQDAKSKIHLSLALSAINLLSVQVLPDTENGFSVTYSNTKKPNENSSVSLRAKNPESKVEWVVAIQSKIDHIKKEQRKAAAAKRTPAFQCI